jgi:hypothetical protein
MTERELELLEAIYQLKAMLRGRHAFQGERAAMDGIDLKLSDEWKDIADERLRRRRAQLEAKGWRLVGNTWMCNNGLAS